MQKQALDIKQYQPIAVLNVGIFFIASAVGLYCLYTASHSESLLAIIAAVIGFSFVNNTLFSLLHEAVHFSFSRNKYLNEVFGVLAAAFFPTGLYYQRICHLGHHARNRTDDEMFDLYYATDKKWLKRLQLYGILTPAYWASIVFGNVMYLVFPWFYDIAKAARLKYKWLDRTGSKMLDPFSKHPHASRIRLEILYSFLFQATVVYALQLSWQGWLLCYLAFGMNWCSVQYADHAWSDRDIINGAWNLKVNRLVQYVFLNYHHHAVHHKYPQLPWIHLHKFVDFSQPRPSFLKIYLSLWRGPRLTEADQPTPVSREFLDVLWNRKI